MDVTREQLRDALAKTRITIEEPEVSSSVHGGPDGWQPLWAKGAPKFPDELAEGVLMLLEVKPGEVVDASICCDHADTDPELSAIAVVFAALDDLDAVARSRVLRWALDRFHVDL